MLIQLAIEVIFFVEVVVYASVSLNPHLTHIQCHLNLAPLPDSLNFSVDLLETIFSDMSRWLVLWRVCLWQLIS